MKRRLRLRKRIDIERVRRHGKSIAHPLLVLIHHPNEELDTRLGVAAGKAVGGAVVRNRTKRRIRAALAGLAGDLSGGSDVLIIARKPGASAPYRELHRALDQLFRRAGLYKKT